MVEKISPPSLARKTVETFLRENKILNHSDFKIVGVETEKAGTFVSVKLSNGNLRGCIGTILPTKNTIEEEIIHNAISAATKDSRFSPVNVNELNDLAYSVDVLTEPEPVRDISEMDPKIYGVIVKSKAGNQGLLLPNLDGVDSVEDQISISKRKANIPINEPVYLFRFRADRYPENSGN